MIRAALAALLVFTVAASSAHAREAPPDPEASFAPPKLDLPSLDRVYRRSLYRRNVGIGISIPGVVLNVLGAVLISYGATDPNLVSAGSEIVSGAIVSFVGLSLAVPGVVLWILGQDAMDVATWRRHQLSSIRLQPFVTPVAGGGAITGLALTF